MGHAVSDETKNQKAWDSNAITPGTPFMDLLASCLRYWITQKVNSDPGWKNVCCSFFFLPVFSFQVYISHGVFVSSKLYFQMPVYPVKENIRSWTLSVDSGLTPPMIQIHGMLFTDW